MNTDTHEESLTPVARAAPPPKAKLSWRAARRRRRKARHRFEELVAWVAVPLILLGLYWGVTAGLEFLGTSPSQVWDQLMQVKQALQKRA